MGVTRSEAGSETEMTEALTGYTTGGFGFVPGHGMEKTVMGRGALAARRPGVEQSSNDWEGTTTTTTDSSGWGAGVQSYGLLAESSWGNTNGTASSGSNNNGAADNDSDANTVASDDPRHEEESSRDCPNLDAGGGRGGEYSGDEGDRPRGCFKCRQRGHIARTA
ncbi:hypothetical protein HPB51_020135 [Rhipicephalus microplus]|uniref:CCHC-type domain-containing protein n=1 Tax=Rhipicephalus microplus TaxID=6941 RepID=A0A9J6EI86_RHIMP|nr:hypothetical protein HPB51_020135 [Rhipicephalus microplus]